MQNEIDEAIRRAWWAWTYHHGIELACGDLDNFDVWKGGWDCGRAEAAAEIDRLEAVLADPDEAAYDAGHADGYEVGRAEAAGDIVRLEAENARLREALATYACRCIGDEPMPSCAGGDLPDCGFRARAALTQPGGE